MQELHILGDLVYFIYRSKDEWGMGWTAAKASCGGDKLTCQIHIYPLSSTQNIIIHSFQCVKRCIPKCRTISSKICILMHKDTFKKLTFKARFHLLVFSYLSKTLFELFPTFYNYKNIRNWYHYLIQREIITSMSCVWGLWGMWHKITLLELYQGIFRIKCYTYHLTTWGF